MSVAFRVDQVEYPFPAKPQPLSEARKAELKAEIKALLKARNAVLVSREDPVWTLRISTGHEVLVNRERLDELSGALENYFQRRIQIQVEYERKAGDTPEAMAEARRQELLVDASRTLHEDPLQQHGTQPLSSSTIRKDPDRFQKRSDSASTSRQ